MASWPAVEGGSSRILGDLSRVSPAGGTGGALPAHKSDCKPPLSFAERFDGLESRIEAMAPRCADSLVCEFQNQVRADIAVPAPVRGKGDLLTCSAHSLTSP